VARFQVHGFDHPERTRLSPDVIELQLAHTEQNEVRAAYNRAQHLNERRTMMQWLADYLDDLRLARQITAAAAWGRPKKPSWRRCP